MFLKFYGKLKVMTNKAKTKGIFRRKKKFILDLENTVFFFCVIAKWSLIELACFLHILESKLLNCYVFKLHLSFSHPQNLSTYGLILAFQWNHHIRKNKS